MFFQAFTLLPQSRGRFAGIETIQVVLFDGRLAELNVSYTGPNWPNVTDFVGQTVALGLPPANDWVRDQTTMTLRCTGFILTASARNGGSGSIALRIATAYEDTVRQRRLADQERRRREFKP